MRVSSRHGVAGAFCSHGGAGRVEYEEATRQSTVPLLKNLKSKVEA